MKDNARRQSRYRLLFLLPFPPRLDAAHGGSRSMAQLLVRLAARHHVALLCLRSDDELPTDEILLETCDLVDEIARPTVRRTFGGIWSLRIRLMHGFLQGRPIWASLWAVTTYHERVRMLRRTWRPDIIQIEYHIMAQYLSALRGCPEPRILTEYEPGIQAAPQSELVKSSFGRLINAIDRLTWQRFESAIMRRVQAVVVFTKEDRQTLAQLAQPTPLVTIPLGTELGRQPLSPYGNAPWSLLFVGNFVHPPNVDAALRLIHQILPCVRKHVPHVTLYLVGDEPPPQIRQQEGEHVIVTGYVTDVTPYLDRAAVVVAPMRLGGGMRVKMLEALAAGKAIVASSLAVNGLDVVDGKHLLVAERDQDFADAIVQLLLNSDRRAALAQSARSWACANLGWQQSVEAYEALYDRLIQQSGQQPRSHLPQTYGSKLDKDGTVDHGHCHP